MKYDITQEQYVDFLNTLDRTQQDTSTGTNLASGTAITNRYVMSSSSSMSYRNGIRCDATIPATGTITFIAIIAVMEQVENPTTGQHIACNTSPGQTVRRMRIGRHCVQ